MTITLQPIDYAFSASARTITFLTLVPATLAHIKHISNATAGAIYFQPQAGVARSGSLDGNVLTLNWDTTADNNFDALLILVEDNVSPASEPAQELTNTHLRRWRRCSPP